METTTKNLTVLGEQVYHSKKSRTESMDLRTGEYKGEIRGKVMKDQDKSGEQIKGWISDTEGKWQDTSQEEWGPVLRGVPWCVHPTEWL